MNNYNNLYFTDRNEWQYDLALINGHMFNFLGIENDCLTYENSSYNSSVHTAKLHLAEWAKHSHGNAPSGTLYGWYYIIADNGKKIYLPVRV